MAVCTFFGHRDCTETIKPRLREVVEELINHHGADMFYVGNQGQFDAMVRGVLRALKEKYPQINYAVVLAYMPGKNYAYYDFSETILPEGIEKVHPKGAISWRNNWMLERSDYVVSYVTHSWGGAAQFVAKAKKQGKTTINLI